MTNQQWHLPETDCVLPAGTKLGWWTGNNWYEVQLLERASFVGNGHGISGHGIGFVCHHPSNLRNVNTAPALHCTSIEVKMVLLPSGSEGWHLPSGSEGWRTPTEICELPVGTKLRWYAVEKNDWIERELLVSALGHIEHDAISYGDFVKVFLENGDQLTYLEEGKPVTTCSYTLHAHKVLLPKQAVAAAEDWRRPPGSSVLPAGTRLRNSGPELDRELLSPAYCYNQHTHLQITGGEAPLVYRKHVLLGAAEVITEPLGTSLLVSEVLLPAVAPAQQPPEQDGWRVPTEARELPPGTLVVCGTEPLELMTRALIVLWADNEWKIVAAPGHTTGLRLRGEKRDFCYERELPIKKYKLAGACEMAPSGIADEGASPSAVVDKYVAARMQLADLHGAPDHELGLERLLAATRRAEDYLSGATQQLHRALAAEHPAPRAHPHEGRSDRALKQEKPTWFRSGRRST